MVAFKGQRYVEPSQAAAHLRLPLHPLRETDGPSDCGIPRAGRPPAVRSRRRQRHGAAAQAYARHASRRRSGPRESIGRSYVTSPRTRWTLQKPQPPAPAPVAVLVARTDIWPAATSRRLAPRRRRRTGRFPTSATVAQQTCPEPRTSIDAPPQLCTSTEPSPSNSATTLAPGRRATEAVSPPESTTPPAGRCSSRAASVLTSQATAAAGSPMTAPPAAVPTTLPPLRNTQPISRRSHNSPGEQREAPAGGRRPASGTGRACRQVESRRRGA